MENLNRDDDVINMVNNQKYVDDTAFFDIVNENARQVNKANADNDRLNAYFAATEKAVQDSVGRESVIAEHNRYIKERAEELRKKRNLKIAALILAGAAFVGGMIYIGNNEAERRDISKATSIVMKNAKYDLGSAIAIARGGSVTFSEDDDIGKMATILSETDYSTFSTDDIKEVYAYSKILPKEEFEEFIRSIQYTQNGVTYNYDSFKQYLSVNGISEEEFDKKAQSVLLEEYRNGNITDEQEKNSVKGGR